MPRFFVKGTEWTAEQDERLLQMHKNGDRLTEMSNTLGRSFGAIRARLEKLSYRKHLPRSAGKDTRPCLGCRRDFASEGPHNRLCSRCRDAARSTSPYAP